MEDKIIVFEITTPHDDMYMVLREDDKMEIGYTIKGAQNAAL